VLIDFRYYKVDPVQQRENGLRGLFLVLVVILGFSQAISAAILFPGFCITIFDLLLVT
jgi:hypothetical protein